MSEKTIEPPRKTSQPGDNSLNGSEDIILEAEDNLGKFSLEIQEDRHGTYIFNSQDICLLGNLKALATTGVDSFKIEGRAKSVYYLAVVTKAYRAVIDAISDAVSDQELRNIIKIQQRELDKLSHRGYSQGFLLGNEPPHLFGKDANKSGWMFCGLSGESSADPTANPTRTVVVHNYLSQGDQVEIITPQEIRVLTVVDIHDFTGQEVLSAHGGTGKPYAIKFSQPIAGIFLMRKQIVRIVP